MAWRNPHDRLDPTERYYCYFGITEAIGASLAAAAAGTATAADIGTLAAAGLGTGALGGAAVSGLTGGNVLKGAEEGGLIGLGTAGGEVLGPLAGIGTAAGGALGGAAGGALGGVTTGGGALSGALSGAFTGGAAGLLAPSAPAGASAPGSAPAPAIAAGAPVDLTSIPAASTTPGDLSTLTPGPVSGPGIAPGAFVSQGAATSATTPLTPATFSLADPSTWGNAFSTAPNGLTPAGTSGGFGAGGTPTGFFGAPTPNQALVQGLPGTGASAAGGAGVSPGSAAWSAFTANPSASTAWNLIKANPGTALAGVGLLYNLMSGANNSAQLGELKNEAQSLQGEGAALAAGNLPPAVQTAVDNATNAAIAQIRSRYAASGQTESTAELQDIQQAQLNAIAMGAQFVNTGINIAGMSSDLLAQIIQLQGGQNAATGQAIANLAAALGGTTRIGGSGININVNGQPTQQAA